MRGYFLPAYYQKRGNVLPILIPEMSYDELAIKNGDEAIAVFVKMTRSGLTNEQIHNFRNQLLEYCCQDTLAMVFLHKKLLQM